MSEHNHKVGDKIKVRDDLQHFEVYGGETFVGRHKGDAMGILLGKECTICELTHDSCNGTPTYFLEEDDEKWKWTEEMFENEK